MATQYPEHEKLHQVVEQSQAIGEFLAHLEENNLTICEWACPEGERRWAYWPDVASIERRLADYFGIDQKRLEAEKRQMLDEQRKINEEVRHANT